MNLLVLGKGTVGGQLLAQVRAQHALLSERHGVKLRVVGIADSRRAAFDSDGLDLAKVEDALERSTTVRRDPLDLGDTLEALRRLPVPILVDCTAATGIESVYREAFRRGIHVVAANKKPLALAWDQREALLAEARRYRVSYLYETTVGASLPVIDPLWNLLRTGDVVERIVASLSGTLGFLCNEVMAGVPLSEAVLTAKERGFTEPDPREDLSGADVARKALILARELGLPLSLSDVALDPFVPADLFIDEPLDAFFRRLQDYDTEFERRIAAHRSSGRCLRYLASIEPARSGTRSPVIQVGPTPVEPGHPAADLRGSESIVSFTTQRHHELPLTVRGAGAGGAVTASGVLADILRISQVVAP